MRTRRAQALAACGLAALVLCAAGGADAGRRRPGSHEAVGSQLFASPQANPIAVAPDGTRVYVANTTSRSVDVIDTTLHVVTKSIEVGLEPVSVAVRPDGLEVWVANHLSDSVSVIDTDLASASLYQVVETIQSLDASFVTLFDEPVGIAFASNTKAYVALSSRNQIAIVNATSYTVTGFLNITAQDPRAITVRNGRLFVAAFESGNRSELSACPVAVPGDPGCTFGFLDLIGSAASSPNLPGIPKHIHQETGPFPDRDLFVFNTSTDSLVGSAVQGVGTLLYGIAVAANGDVFVTNTDARNNDVDGNGLASQPDEGFGGLGLGLDDLQNRAFRNRISRIPCGGASCGSATATDLEPPPGSAVPTPLATPYGIALSADGTVAVTTAAASNRIAAVSTSSLAVLHSLSVGAIPRGVAFRSPAGATGTAYVLNTLGNSVSVVNVASGGSLSLLTTIPVGADPTPENVRLGRIAFESAGGSSSGTFACASCHPDAGVDQLLWFIGAVCALPGDPDQCDQEEQRSTMPVRGLSRSLPLHWDGTLGDPFGGANGEVGPSQSAAANCSTVAGEQECFRHLVNASLSGVMCNQSSCPNGPSGLPGKLDATERENMALFLQRVAYAPARERAVDDAVSLSARRGFADFFMEQGGNGGTNAQTCADTTGGCHALPLGVSTNSVVVGAFDAPTMRGMTDRFLQFSGGFTNPKQIQDEAPGLTQFVGCPTPGCGVKDWEATGTRILDELTVFSIGFLAFNPAYDVLPDNLFQMFEEASTGTSGATGRQVTLNTATATLPATADLMTDLEQRDLNGVVNLRAVGLRGGVPATLSFRADGTYKSADGTLSRTPAQLRSEAASGTLLMTLTAALRSGMGDPATPQPLLGVTTTGAGPTGDPDLPLLPGDNPMTLRGVDVLASAPILVDGAPVAGSVSCVGGSFTPFCSSQTVSISLSAVPGNGLHLLQVQNPNGPLSNEVPICVGSVASCQQP